MKVLPFSSFTLAILVGFDPGDAENTSVPSAMTAVAAAAGRSRDSISIRPTEPSSLVFGNEPYSACSPRSVPASSVTEVSRQLSSSSSTMPCPAGILMASATAMPGRSLKARISSRFLPSPAPTMRTPTTLISGGGPGGGAGAAAAGLAGRLVWAPSDEVDVAATAAISASVTNRVFMVSPFPGILSRTLPDTTPPAVRAQVVEPLRAGSL